MRAIRPSPEQFVFALFLLLLSSGIYGEVLAQDVATSDLPVVKTQGYIPFAEGPIHYRSAELHDPIAELQGRLDRGIESLKFDAQHGYLPDVLRALNIPESSQSLVFSKTSFQFPQISPTTPRAIFFNDDIYAGRVHDGKFLEFISFDPVQGAIFYVLDEQRTGRPVFERAAGDCVQCHVSASTRGVPGVMLRSVFTRATGYPLAGSNSYITGHESPLNQRWGGWYVTGLQSSSLHMGNAVVEKGSTESVRQADIGSVLECGSYLRRSSDVVALLVLAHQTQMHNLITQLSYAGRTGTSKEKLDQLIDELSRYLPFEKEAPLNGAAIAESPFIRDFSAHALHDSGGRSLRDFDLHRRIFKYPCSYLIYFDDFNALPEETKQSIYENLFQKLTRPEDSLSPLNQADRTAILEILLETKPDLPPDWKQYVTKRNAKTFDAARPCALCCRDPPQTACKRKSS